jgi:hypothetical protein
MSLSLPLRLTLFYALRARQRAYHDPNALPSSRAADLA